jgi:glycosyltransferase involved in cell wall biosynthesis
MSELHCRCCGSKATYLSASNYLCCKECESSCLHPEATISVAQGMLLQYKKSLPEYDESFDWRVFLLRVLLRVKGDVLDIGIKNSTLSGLLEKEGYHLHTADLNSAKSLSAGYDSVILWDVLENSPTPYELIKLCNLLLKNDGLLLIRIKDSGSVRNVQKGDANTRLQLLNKLTQNSLTFMIHKVVGVYPLFVQMECYGEDFLICVVKKGERFIEPSLRALVIAHPDAYALLEDAVGPRMRIIKTILALRQQGIMADLSISPYPQCKSYDIIHLFHHTWGSRYNLQQALCAKYLGKPLVISTIYMDISETNFALRAIPSIFKIPLQDEREGYLKALSEGELKISGFSQKDEILQEPDIKEIQKTLFILADHLIGLSLTEIRQIGLTLNVHKSFTIVPNCADPAIFYGADQDNFIKKYGIKDFVLSVGHIEIRKNTLMLLYALKKTPYHIVIIGNYRNNEEYFHLCQYYAPENTTFITQLPQDDLASAFAAARVHALPSWTEGASLSSIEAAMSGCNILVSNRAGEWEYFQEEGFYCNPANITSIKEAVDMAYKLGDESRRKKLQERAVNSFTFEKAVVKTIEAYQKTLYETKHS